jgi:hypothetical protein
MRIRDFILTLVLGVPLLFAAGYFGVLSVVESKGDTKNPYHRYNKEYVLQKVFEIVDSFDGQDKARIAMVREALSHVKNAKDMMKMGLFTPVIDNYKVHCDELKSAVAHLKFKPHIPLKPSSVEIILTEICPDVDKLLAEIEEKEKLFP